jgi:hypothetical protein
MLFINAQWLLLLLASLYIVFRNHNFLSMLFPIIRVDRALSSLQLKLIELLFGVTQADWCFGADAARDHFFNIFGARSALNSLFLLVLLRSLIDVEVVNYVRDVRYIRAALRSRGLG